ncbi:GNAT family N-acetyltransferase [Pseudanabaena sp. FACHB-2040]|uniref:GNAT family N-acetyltransferase n=1 Tax=Pseudanabaena sp. FACHB-2040 TaxID=2692859 RepID=UPI00168233C5|nr:GNAT family N-acetyltransferase [Pseudanabaena sp. FACHB-2040]MBD2257147.1 GNAT family N-acetyltransferase [Pseudanabaena sp. FACHB-2040]
MDIRYARSETELSRCFPVMVQLRPHLSQAEFINRVLQQRQEGYQLVYVQAEDGVKAVAGFRIQNLLAHGRILYVDDLVTDASSRSQSYGKQLITWLHEQAQAQGCSSLQLDSGVQRADAHRFYFREGLVITSFRFVKPL